MGKPLPPYFFNRPTLQVAEDLLGCFLCRRTGKRVIRAEITEVEAYDGPEDRASHAHRGRTARNAPMFGKAGRWYVYFTYGMHWLLNIVTGPEGYPAAVLIRSVICRGQTSPGSLTSTKWPRQTVCRSLTSTKIDGPARLTKFLRIDKRFNSKKAAVETGLWLEPGIRAGGIRGRRNSSGANGTKKEVRHMPRIGVAYAGPVWTRKPYRLIAG